MVLGAKARALMLGRTHATTEDLRTVAYPVLTHRIIVNFAAAADGVGATDIIDKILETVKVREERD